MLDEGDPRVRVRERPGDGAPVPPGQLNSGAVYLDRKDSGNLQAALERVGQDLQVSLRDINETRGVVARPKCRPAGRLPDRAQLRGG